MCFHGIPVALANEKNGVHAPLISGRREYFSSTSNKSFNVLKEVVGASGLRSQSQNQNTPGSPIRAAEKAAYFSETKAFLDGLSFCSHGTRFSACLRTRACSGDAGDA
jgi:hypothetical protein